MSDGGYKIRSKSANHFLTFTVVVPIAIGRVDVFTRKVYRDILLDSIKYCQQNKGLILNAWCLMANHMHLVAKATNQDLSNILCDLKKFTSKEIIRAIANNKSESRREWMMRIFKEQGTGNSRNKVFQFWRQDNRPTELYSPAFTFQKINYIHQNPVRAGIVDKAEEYLCSNARDYHFGKRCGLLEVKFL